MKIRSETPQDYSAIAAVHVRAFGQRVTEALIVSLNRQQASFDPDLSLVAERDGRIVGHALFSPHRLRLLGETVQAVALAPIAVDPAYQQQGIGGALINAGHAIAREKGYDLSFLLGHISYYPRFGYERNAFGGAALLLAEPELPHSALDSRPLTDADLPTLHELWLHEERAVDFALEPGNDLLDWLSPNPAIEAAIWCQDEIVLGYTRIHQAEPLRPRVFMAKNYAAARLIAGSLVQRATPSGAYAELVLPLHPASASAGAFGTPASQVWEAAMVCPFTNDSPYQSYRAQLEAGERTPGRVIWPVTFDLE